MRLICAFSMIVLAAPALGAGEGAVPDFDRHIAPLLAARCLECHNAADRKGKLDLSSAAGLAKGAGGEAVIDAKEPLKGTLWQMVSEDEMPPKHPLTGDEKAMIRGWLVGGAKWGKVDPIDPFAFSSDKRAGYDFWSLRPIVRPAPPPVKDEAWVINDIDRFVLAKLEAKGLKPNPPADPRTLIRRVYFDLIGLPPTPAEVEAFVAECREEGQAPRAKGQGEGNEARPHEGAAGSAITNHQSPITNHQSPYERLIDRLLASPHYGERWARHWLDIARYTESQGFEYDRFRPNAWHYRDYVIQAFNSDMPYDQFMTEQIAGDVMEEGKGRGNRAEGQGANPPSAPLALGPSSLGPSSLVATSLLVCGPWDQAGNSQANQTQRMVTREEEQEDLIATVGQAFLGLTVNCARCHAHKFDPIPQEDYYRFKSIFDGVRHGERDILTPADRKAREEAIAGLSRVVLDARQSIAAIEAAARKVALEKMLAAAPKPGEAVKAKPAGPQPYLRWTFDADAKDSLQGLAGELIGGATIKDGRLHVNGDKQYFRSAALAKDIGEKTLEAWVILSTLDQGGGGVITVQDSRGGVFDSIVFAERKARMWMAGSNVFQRTKDLAAEPESAKAGEVVHMAIVYGVDNSIAVYRNGRPYAAPYKQHALQTYQAGDAQVVLGLRHTGAGNGFLAAQIDSASLYDRALSAQEIAESFAAGGGSVGPVVTAEQIEAALTPQQRQQREQHRKAAADADARLAALPAPGKSYVGLREQPPPTRRLNRGDVKSPAEVVAPGALSGIRTLSPDFGLPADAPEAQRRLALARWLADPKNPLPARVMVNRLWLHHLGRGIVETPSDLGFNGSRPTHPELLDWLAAEFVGDEKGSTITNQQSAISNQQSPWSLKRLHKFILLSATYRQSSAFNKEAAAVDADNALLWRYAPRRLEGEIIRDSLLAISGKLNPQMGGPSFRPFTVTNHGSDFYHLIDEDRPEFNRRTIYRAHVNSGKSPMMDALDCPDPSVKVPARRVTTTPLAALALMNNSFVQRQCKALAARVLKEANQDAPRAIVLAHQYAFGRPPTAQEAQAAGELAKEHGLEQLCWVLVNATEFLYVK